jgi:hypothetical protein
MAGPLTKPEPAFLPLGTKNGVVIHYAQKPNSPLYLIRGRTTVRRVEEPAHTRLCLLKPPSKVRVDQDTLKATLISYTDARFNTVFRHVDPMVRGPPRGAYGATAARSPERGPQFSHGKVLDYYPRDYAFPSIDFSSVKWARYTFPTGLLSDRDFLFVEHTGEVVGPDGRKTGFGVGGSLVRPEWPELESVVRAEIFMSGYVFRQLEQGDNTHCELTCGQLFSTRGPPHARNPTAAGTWCRPTPRVSSRRGPSTLAPRSRP